MPRKEPYRWNNNTVRMILRLKEYAGYTVNFKTYSKSYKLKKRLPNSPENILEIPDTQEAIVPLANGNGYRNCWIKSAAHRNDWNGRAYSLVWCSAPTAEAGCISMTAPKGRRTGKAIIAENTAWAGENVLLITSGNRC